ncbi:polysaccharide deacetylase family protein [candidate division KSB1 bacterium]|nr:MAG: polysaccharide deacetylase family protein [candidate division KSB1 bacterium]MBC6947543.1 polysaccharide deacetylase family protein [candidate division KSB1 bacterium]MCE7942265.1 polysaccharide deacetylase family protein [Chlorobi bacterium CHB1]
MVFLTLFLLIMLPIVLAYHQVGGRKTLGITWITSAQFERQMIWLAEAGYRTSSLTDYLNNNRAIAGKKIVLTFDDGFRALAKNALPVLQRFGFTATVYPVADYVGRENRWDVNFFGRRTMHLDWDELRDMLAAGWEIGSHSLRHAYLPSLSEAELFDDLRRSREILEDHLNIPIRHLSLPFGRGNHRVFEAARQAGYHTVATLGQRQDNLAGQIPSAERRGLMIVPRRGIYLHDTLNSFQRRVETGGDSKREYLRQRAISFFSTGTIVVKAFGKLGGAVKKRLEI